MKPDKPTRFAWLTRAALFIAIVLVIARATGLETLRDPFEIAPNQTAPPRTITAAASVVLDWLAFTPALLVLLRRAFDRSFRMHRHWSVVPLVLLAVLAAASAIWSNDRYAAVVGSFHFVAGVALLWATAQVVRSWRDLRLVGGACFALLLVLVAYGLIYRYVDLPDTQKSIERDWPAILAQRGWEPDSFTAMQFKKKVLAGESVGFSSSPNSYAAILVMLSIVSIGVAIDRLRDRSTRASAAVILIALLPAAMVFGGTRSKAAFATLGLAAICFALSPLWSERRRAILFGSICALIVAAVSALIAYGVTHHNLHQDSLNFRWRYWTASARLVEQHPLLGVGWDNFGDRYLAVREPAAAEEIKDPHDLFVRFASELGIFSAMLAVVWLLLTWWELSAPPKLKIDDTNSSTSLSPLAFIAGGSMVLSIFAAIDLSQDASWVFIEVMKRGLYAGLLFIALIVTTLRSFQTKEFDGRAAPWIRMAILIALGMFLIHNTIDISFFETGPMWVFMLLCGAALGQQTEQVADKARRTLPATVFTALAFAWVVTGIGIVAPMLIAESKAQTGDDQLATDHPQWAANEYIEAYSTLTFSNSDYLYRAARAQIFAQARPDEIRQTIGRGVSANATSPALLNLAANFEARQNDLARAAPAFERALAVDPNNVDLRLQFADLLKRFGSKREAVEQYQLALKINDQFDATEPKRLSPAKLAAIRASVDELQR